MVLGMVGQYVARICNEVRAQPLYLVRAAPGVAPEGSGDPEELWRAARSESLANGHPVPLL